MYSAVGSQVLLQNLPMPEGAQYQGILLDSIQVLEETESYLQWRLLDCNGTSGRPPSLPNADLMVVMEASLLDCGGHLGEVGIRGFWTSTEFRLHTNLLELRANHSIHEGRQAWMSAPSRSQMVVKPGSGAQCISAMGRTMA